MLQLSVLQLSSCIKQGGQGLLVIGCNLILLIQLTNSAKRLCYLLLSTRSKIRVDVIAGVG